MFLRISSGMRAIGLVSVFWCLFVMPSQLKAQGYPQVYFLTQLHSETSGGASGGPDWESIDHDSYIYAPGNPLVINSVRVVSDLWGYDYHTHIDTLYEFPGFLEQHDDYFKVCTPNGRYYQTPRFRVATIDYQGYYLEDHYYEYPWSHNPKISIWYQYDDTLHLTGSMTKYNLQSVPRWYKYECLLDSLGHRLQDIQYSSLDSLTWTPNGRHTYLYSPEPLGFDFKYEKYLPYVPNGVWAESLFLPYLDWEFKLLSVTNEGVDSQGNWYDAYTWNLNYVISTDELVLIDQNYGSEYQRYDLTGLARSILRDEAGFTFGWEHTSNVDVQDNLISPAPNIAIFPNPTLLQARLQLSLPKALQLKVQTYNLKGQLVKSDVHSGTKAGINEFPWNATDSRNIPLPSGIYLIRCEWEKGNAVVRVAVVK